MRKFIKLLQALLMSRLSSEFSKAMNLCEISTWYFSLTSLPSVHSTFIIHNPSHFLHLTLVTSSYEGASLYKLKRNTNQLSSQSPWRVEKISRPSYNPNIQSCVQKSPLLYPKVTYFNPDHILTPYFFKIHFNIILPYRPWPVSFRISG